MTIRHTSFSHGWFYHYRVHTRKTQALCARFPELDTYMKKMFDACPDHYFLTGPRSSALKFDLGIKPYEIKGHEISQLAGKGAQSKKYRTAHSNVEVYLLENDSSTIAVELPLWLHNHELESFQALFETEDPLSGHIDVLRVEQDGKIWIWDYKPSAHKEKYATCQTYFYAMMLSKRTGIPLEEFRCGYFDEERAYIFKPTQEHVATIKQLKLQPLSLMITR
jgi:hypothetical protein